MMLQPLKTKRQAKQTISLSDTLVAPIGGWNTKDALASMRPIYAVEMDNWFPTARSVTFRKGATNHATGFPLTVKHVMAWRGTAGQKLFGCTDGGIYDCTAAGAVGASVSTITNGLCRHVNYTTTGGSFLFVVNGTNDLRYYNGTTWTTVASFSINGGGTLNTNLISQVQVFKRSLYFIEKDSMNFYYLPVDSIAGNVSKFPLGALFREGGKLLAMATWTVDGGDGQDDFAAFFTSEGQVAIYQGTDPSSASTWALQGVYDIGKPVGNNFVCKFGGDCLILCDAGLVSLSRYLQSTTVDRKSLLSDLINPTVTTAIKNYGSLEGWQIHYNPSNDFLLVNAPYQSFTKTVQFVMNTETGAWCRFTGWDATAWEELGKVSYFAVGTRVAKAWQDSGDFGVGKQGVVKQAWTYLKPPSKQKQINQVRPMVKLEGAVSVNIAIDVDFAEGTDYGPALVVGTGVSRYDTGTYDSAVWGALPITKLDWLTVPCFPGYTSANRLRAVGQDVSVEWFATDYAYEAGEIQG